MRRFTMALKTTAPKLSGPEIKARRKAAEATTAYGVPEKALIGGKTTETIMREVYDQLLVGDLDAAKAEVNALWKREIVNRLTFHPDA
jgi:hypothetical protein